MKKTLSARLKAIFLLLVFGLNTVVGFACALGADMGFNTTHHHEEEATEVHVHADGSKHHHKKKAGKHTHEQNKNDCCSDKVAKISQADKAVPQSSQPADPVFFAAYITVYYNLVIFYTPQVNVFNKHFVRGHHPPISDIRIAIQSFQI